ADPEKSNFTFIAYYAHFACWHLRTANPGFGSEKKSSVQRIDSILKAAVTNYGVTALQMLSLAYLMTEDIRYGHAGAQILLRIAEIYPEMDVSVYPWEKGFKQSHGGAGLGTITGRISDCFLTREIALSYDALFPAITDEFAGYISGNKLRYMSEPPKKGKEIRNIIESKFLTEIFQNVKDNRVFGNPGMQQNTLLAAGVVSENDELLRQYTDYVFRFVNHERTMQHVYDVDSILINEIDRDGHAGEVSPAYNSIWFSGFCDLAENLAGREGLEEYDLYNNPKFLNMAKMDKNTLMIDRYTLPIADSIMAGEPIIYTAKSAHQKFFKKTGSINSAQLIHAVSDGENYCDDLFSDCAAIDEEIRKIVREHGPLQSESRCLSGYGLYVLEKGEEKSSVYMFNGRNSGHGHRDTLSIGLHGFGVDLTPDHGYPNYADRNYERMRWTSNTISHNTVFVNHEINHDSNPNVRPQYNGPVYHFDSDSLVGVIDCASPTIFENTPLYRRSVVSVALDEESRYIVDFFRVVGDAEHVYSFHAAGFETESRGIQLEKQEKGTYAGDEIPFADEEYSKNSSTGYNYLDEVSRCKSTDAPFSLDWKIHDNWHVWEKPRDVHLRLHMLSNLEECATATGRPPQARPGNAKKFTYLLAKKNGEGCFTSVIEPYENNSFIEDSRIVFDGGTEQCAIVVKHKTGREDIIICSISNKVVSFLYGKNDIDFSGHMTVLSFDTDGSLSYIYVNDGNRLEVNGVSYDCCPSHECSIEGFTKVLSRDNFVDVKTSANPYGLKG
ncbi:MAG: hypothetical protein GX633_07425, partial [Clostridiales bacterium]|nr:hypothetical protein [Clostridiales bacterium]